MAIGDIFSKDVLLPAAGAVAGGFMGGPTGALAGASVGQTASQLLGMGQELPETVGPTGAQKSALGVSQQLLERSAAQRGMSAQQVANMSLLAQQQQTQQMLALNTLKQRMFSPLEQEMLGKRLLADVRQGQVQQMRALQDFDSSAEARNITQANRLAASTFAMGSDIQRIEAQQEAQRRQMKLQRLQNLQSLIGTSVQAINIASQANRLADEAATKQAARTSAANIAKDTAAAPLDFQAAEARRQARLNELAETRAASQARQLGPGQPLATGDASLYGLIG